MKKQELSSFYLEALLLVAVFVAMILVLTGVFGAARSQSRQARQLTSAVTLSANAAEAAAAADSPEELAALLDEGGNVAPVPGGLEAYYRLDGSPCRPEEAQLRLTVSWQAEEGERPFIQTRFAVFRADAETPLYTLESAHLGRGAAA